MSTLEKALPCPFCAEAKIFYGLEGIFGAYAISCGNRKCGVTLYGVSEVQQEAIKQWNTRPVDGVKV